MWKTPLGNQADERLESKGERGEGRDCIDRSRPHGAAAEGHLRDSVNEGPPLRAAFPW